MSYDLELGVKVEGGNDLFVRIARPEYDSPTYNIGKMFRACMDWDFEQGKWYRVSDILPHIERGITELEYHEKKYKKYDSPNGWGTTMSALSALQSLYKCIQENSGGCDWPENEIPLNLLYMRW